MRLLPGFDLVGGPLVVGALSVAALGETASPLRVRRRTRRSRWAKNAAFGLLAASLVRGLVVPAIVRCAGWSAKRDMGLIRSLPIPWHFRAAARVLALDYTMYLWHRALHRVSALWRFHSAHHADVDLDASTALRFHAAELAASIPFRCAQVMVLGVSPRLALGYEVAMQIAAVFHHSNTRFPERLERFLGAVVVTPRMHGIHHSIETRELQSNWSVIFSVWDRVHGTHRSRATQPQIGLARENDPR